MPDRLRVLGFDTSAAHCAAAVVCGGRVLAQRIEPMARGQAERLFPLLAELLAEAGLGWSDLDAIGVGEGPGNFTGIRISVAAARGLALSLRIPAVGVTVTEAAACDAPRPCRAIVALRGDEVVWQDFPALRPDTRASFDAGQDGPPALARREALPPGPAPCCSPHSLPVAIALLAAQRVAAVAERAASADADIARPAPLYLRPADAAPPRDPPPVILP
ncbi:MAG TPA: tRNA (adenosine(37)-N6)-threonylcarbamoyltransferase complex dimerization subunit type 1 TsaB [Paracoccus solventivorans]|uniref:tRNA (adenosine(37)-N6)-threonylcarbamoyltransferase complex dimerization subunit type 1 TsaB n=1 Tax=Paracoccus solventivorans TaxID=53463 RepID=UPI002CE80B88|nr:tRNA (adenosine(37)-N6)-threonylcarbamoyltransferase complex dimerization subunit type 1 TsaB [Paracoccus solventivorans]HMM07779.1 tRNA (adenosine(37)-N6)-threonylcarbamoyltransferase complex dimerization subunit type 1 TsaB [Paracoccus solventivorans]